jgi:chromosome segregation ATPase
MYLEKLELQGFKSFAQKTTMTFPARGRTNPGIAAIVGPNGSGKSNVADAVRWVLGEQSIKLLRGKRAEDVIFSGSGKLPRLGFAEISLYLNNKDKKADIEYSQVIVKRRVYRNGESQYHINNARVRLSDVQLLLAQANFGQRTYSVIGQGMTDAILAASPYERKNFFDEATGVKQYQIKREQAQNKIKATEENLAQVKSLIREIKPRVLSLKEQIEKRDKRKHLESKLHKLQIEHYGALWHKITNKRASLLEQKRAIEKEHLAITKKITQQQNKLQSLEKTQKKAALGEYDKVQSRYHESLTKKNELTSSLAGLTHELSVLKSVEKAQPTNIDSKSLIENTHHSIDILKTLASIKSFDAFKKLIPEIKKLRTTLQELLAGENKTNRTTTTEKIRGLNKKVERITHELEQATREVEEKQNFVDKLRRAESRATTDVFDTQKKYQSLQQELNSVVNQKNTVEVELARVETQKKETLSSLEHEVHHSLHEHIKNYHAPGDNNKDLWPEIAHTRNELEMIGAIDPSADKEYKEIKKRYDFLSVQLSDLERALKKTHEVRKQLDEVIEKQFNKSFEKIEKGFSEYFKLLFVGGKVSLVLRKQSELESLNEDVVSGLTKKEQEQLANTFKMGIEITASPPGKKVTTINMLSGGERALTSIALICAIIKANPSPFVVLDEVDAALDEANSERFAAILEKLARITQFITITHNRATMEQAQILYGVTMSEDGTSKLLSVDLEKALKSIA